MAARCAGTALDRRSPRGARSLRRRGTRSAPRDTVTSTPSAHPAATISSTAPCSRSISRVNDALVAITTRSARDRERGDQRALDHAVRVGADDRTVLERAGLTFGRVHGDDRGNVGALVRRDRSPLPTGREPRTASPAQAGRIDLVDHRGRAEPAGRFETLAAPERSVRVEVADRWRVEDARFLHHGPSVPAPAPNYSRPHRSDRSE